MTELLGEKIEDLLWKAGCDTDRVVNDDEIWSLHVTVGVSTVVLSEIFFTDDAKWATDPDTLTLEKLIDGEPVDSDLTVVASEEELVEHILALGDE